MAKYGRSSRNEEQRDERRQRGRERRRRESTESESDSDTSVEIEKPRMKAKPVKIPTRVNRSCTDIVFLILFVVVMLAWAMLAGFAFTQVNLKKMIAPKDSEDVFCGGEGAKDRKLLYFKNFDDCLEKWVKSDLTLDCGGKKFCVAACPESTNSSYKEKVCLSSAANVIDNSGDGGENKYEEFVKNGSCLSTVIPSGSLFSICLPIPSEMKKLNFNASAQDVAVGLIDVQHALRFTWDVQKSALIIAGGLGIALVLGFLWLTLMRFFAGVIVWITTLLFVVMFAAIAAVAGYRAKEIYHQEPHEKSFDFSKIKSFDLNYLSGRIEVVGGTAAVAALLFVLSFSIILFLRKRIQTAVALIKQASRSISAIPSIVVFPVLPYIGTFITIAFTITLALMTDALSRIAAKDPARLEKLCLDITDNVANSTQTNNATSLVCSKIVEVLSHTTYVHIFNVAAGVWMLFFINAFGFLVIAHSVSKYFWTHKEDGSQCLAIFSSVGIAIRYHLGSLAFGSIIVGIVSIIKWILQIVQSKTKGKTDSTLVKYLLKCCVCCFWAMEKFLKYINRNAYIMIAMYGKNFCRSAARAFSLIMNNVLRAIVVTKITDYIIFFAKLVNVFAVSALTYLAFTNESVKNYLSAPEVYTPIFPTAAVAVGSYIVLTCFFGVYSDTVDTLFLCFLEDKKINDGSRDRPYRMPKELLRILNKKNYGTKNR